MALSVGSVHVDVVPSTREFVKTMRADLLKEADSIGKDMGERIGRHVSEQVSKPIVDSVQKSVEDGVSQARTDKGGDKAGKEAGSAFRKAFEREVRSALDALPAAKVDADTSPAQRQIAELRKELQGFFDAEGKLKIDVADEDGLAKIAEIRAELLQLQRENVDIPVDFDIEQAVTSLGKLEAQARDHGDRAGGNFANSLRSSIDSALRALPDIRVPVDADTDPALARLQGLQRQLASLRDLEIGVDINDVDAIAGLHTLLAELDAIAGNDIEIPIRIRDDATASAIALRSFLERFPDQQPFVWPVDIDTAPAERHVGAFARQIQVDIGRAVESLPDIDLNLDSTAAEFRIAAIRRELVTLGSQRIGIDIDAETALARMTELTTRLHTVKELAGTKTSFEFDADQAITALGRTADAFDEVTKSAEGGRRTLNRAQEIGLLITLAFTPAAAAILGLAAAGIAVIAPIAAVVAGISGIKAAVGPLTDDLDRMRAAVSAAFVAGLQPAVGAVAQLMPTLTSGLVGVAGSLSSVATEITSVVAQAPTLTLLTTTFDQMSAAVTGLGSPLATLVANTISLADIGSGALVSLGPLLDQVGAAWTRVIDALRSSGDGQTAIVALLQGLTAILSLLAPLVQLGSTMFAVLGPALAAAINGTAVVVQALADAFGALPGPIQAIIASALLLRVGLSLADKSIGQLKDGLIGLAGKGASGIAAPFQDGAAAVQLFRETLDTADRSTSAWSQTTQSAGERVRSTLDGIAESARTRIPQAFETAGQVVSDGLVRATNAAASGFERLAAAAGPAAQKVGQALSSGLGTVIEAVAKGFERLPDAAVSAAQRTAAAIRGAPMAALTAMEAGVNKAVDGFVAGWKRAEDATVAAGKAILAGWVAAENALVSGASAVGKAWDSAGNVVVGAGKAILSGWVAAENALVSGASAVGKAWDSAGNVVVGAGKAILSGWVAAENALVSGASAVGRAWDTAGAGLTKALTAVDSAVNAVMTNYQRLPQIVGAAARSASTAVADGLRGMSESVTTSVARLPQIVGDATRSMSTAVANGLRGTQDAIGRIPDAFRSMGSAIGTALSSVPQVVAKTASAIEAGFVRIGTVAESAGRALSSGMIRAVGGLLDALGGPWGLVIAAAVAALSLFGAAQADAAQKSAEFKQSVNDTAQAMREAGGAVTDNMRQAEALSLIQKNLSTDANALNLNLVTLSDTAISGGAAWDQLRTKLEETARAGDIQRALAMDSTTALTEQGVAAIAAGDAAQHLLDALGPLADKYRQAADENRIFSQLIQQSGNSMVLGVGNAAQLTTALNTMSDEMANTAKRATALYTAMLLLTGGTLPAEVAISAMRGAMADTAKAFTDAEAAAKKAGDSILNASGQIDTTTVSGRALVDSLTAVGKSALDAATSAFDAAGGMANMEAASRAASDVITQQREAFVKAAEGAGLGVDAANRYADQLGLIPNLVTTLLEMKGLPQAQQELLQVQGLVRGASVGAVIPINVSGGALKALQDIGIKIVQLPEGKVGVVVDDKTAPQVQTILTAIAAQNGQLRVIADASEVPAQVAQQTSNLPPALLPVKDDPTPFGTGVDILRQSTAGGPPAQLPVKADVTPVPPAIDAVKGIIQAPVDMQIQPGDLEFITVAVNGIRHVIETPANFSIGVYDNASGLINTIRTTATTPAAMPITATDVGAVGFINATRLNAAQVVAMPLTAIDQGALGVITGIRTAAIAVATMPVAALDQGATGIITGLRTAATTVAIMPIDANDALARGKLSTLINDVNRSTGTITVNANTSAAQTAIDRLKQPTSSTHTVYIQTVGTLPRAQGGIVPADFSFFANGGLHNGRLTPMPANKAKIVQPNTFRVIGDRARDSEAYIPINRSERSQAILRTTAVSMGWNLVPLATGGLFNDRLLASGVLQGSVSTQSTGAFTPTGSAAPSTTGSQGVETRLDALIAAVQSQRAVPPITVEDRSGNPVETARSVQLALRLAR